ncbi:hypothetical protein POKO110462_05680 [Pontibacter korlensis]|uniref:Outer membrane protein beta-barrel domain-containing protein n=1 Tax=Pontibacter korlensis TaxID=400092 RepID=A0A0E3ZE38_9BACT|nr:hypothetical protein [Pontibacter korlensis]AKD03438.1 hypothetical protein PKOR_10250 [Pontibacter korlensis]
MKNVLLLLTFCCATLHARAQTRHTINLELLGKNIVGPAVLYERNPNADKKLSLHYGAGIGTAYGQDAEWHPSLPLFVGANLGRSNNKFELGLAGFLSTRDYFDTRVEECYGCMDSEYESMIVPFTLYLGFKHYPEDGEGLFFHINTQPILITNSFIPILPWIGAGIGYSLKKQ